MASIELKTPNILHVDFFVTEFLPDYLALDYQFMIFHIGEEEENQTNLNVKAEVLYFLKYFLEF